MLSPCVVISVDRRFRQIWPLAIFFLWGYLKAKVYEQRPVTLEALKEAIRKEVAAITTEMILKVMDNYRERLHQCINIQGHHLSDVLFKTHWCKTAFCVLSRNRKNICRIFFGFEFIRFSNRGVLSAAPCIIKIRGRLIEVQMRQKGYHQWAPVNVAINLIFNYVNKSKWSQNFREWSYCM